MGFTTEGGVAPSGTPLVVAQFGADYLAARQAGKKPVIAGLAKGAGVGITTYSTLATATFAAGSLGYLGTAGILASAALPVAIIAGAIAAPLLINSYQNQKKKATARAADIRETAEAQVAFTQASGEVINRFQNAGSLDKASIFYSPSITQKVLDRYNAYVSDTTSKFYRGDFKGKSAGDLVTIYAPELKEFRAFQERNIEQWGKSLSFVPASEGFGVVRHRPLSYEDREDPVAATQIIQNYILPKRSFGGKIQLFTKSTVPINRRGGLFTGDFGSNTEGGSYNSDSLKFFPNPYDVEASLADARSYLINTV